MKKSFLLAAAALTLHACVPAVPAFADMQTRVPTDALRLNAFVQRYNAYVDELSAGKVDVRQWKRVEEAWQRLR